MNKAENSSASEQSLENGRVAIRGWPRVALFCALAILGAVGGYFAARARGHRIQEGVVMAGLPLGGLKAGEARERLAARCEKLGSTPVTLALDSRSFLVTPAAAGFSLDYETSVRRALAVGRTGSLLTRLRERKAVAEHGLTLDPEIKVQAEKWEEFCRGLEAEVNAEPVEAHLTVDREGRIKATPSRDGGVLDRAALARLLYRALYLEGDRRHQIRVATVKPRLSSRDIETWPLDQVLGLYTTKFNPSDDQRSHNLRMAAAAIDGIILAPGEEFSFNKNVGPRVPESGYMEAGVVSRNRLILGVGGGVCQVSGTLFNAVLLANLPISKRTTHSIPSTYVPLGRDATVVYDAVDLAFINDTGRPVVITSLVEGKYLTIAAVGHRERRPQVELSVEVKEKIPFETVTENDPGLAAGTQAVTQWGREGYKVQLWRIVAWPGRPKVREPIGGVAYYPPNKKIIKRGIGSPRFGAMTPPAKPPAPAAEEARPPAPESAPPSGGDLGE